ncbi:Succinate dehydrogenase cytochrome b560 subunit, mitochondrial [Armadillidium vulgare]|nr:Succinate dehydrogenase cytochrome b560 subunit, mitochondrial [Armadillidium vulgare]
MPFFLGNQGFYTSSKQEDKAQTNEDYWAKNKRLNRPVSPHLTIYKPQITTMLSIAHRGTGLYLAFLVSGFSLGMLSLPQSFPHYLSVIEEAHYGSIIIFLAKFSLAFPFVFHMLNGIRHLSWDLGFGFSLRSLYKSGYFVLGTSLTVAAILSAL